MAAERSTHTCNKQKTLQNYELSKVIQNTWTVTDIQILIKSQSHRNILGNAEVTKPGYIKEGFQ